MVTDYLVPGILTLTALFALHKKENVYEGLTDGAAQGLNLLKSIFPSLVVLLCGVNLLRASGALEALSRLLGPLCRKIGLPPETLPLVLVRPFSGSAALAVGADLMRQYGVDSTIGRTAAVMLGSTETTFYTVSVYFRAAGVRRTRYTIPAALCADAAGFLFAALWTRVIMG
jgi:spore maturation protein B